MKSLPSNSSLSEIFTNFLPNNQQTLFLRSCLWRGKKAAEAWANWCEIHSDTRLILKQKNIGLKGLTPLLFHNLQRNGLPIDPSLLTFFRTAQTYEEKRTKVYREICHQVLAALTTAGKRFLVVKGAALADTAFEDPSLRHCHDLDIVLDDYDLSSTLALISSLEFSLASKNIPSEWEKITLIHRHGLPVCLHRGLFGLSFCNRGQQEIWNRSEKKTIADVPCQVLRPADALLHVCGQAFFAGRSHMPTWVADSWAIMDRFPDFPWEQLIISATRNHLALPVFVMLRFLADQLHAPIPSTVLAALAVSSSESLIGQELALSIARKFSSQGLREVVNKTNSWRSRLAIVKWMVFPYLDYLHWTHPGTESWAIPFHYVSRPLQYLVRRF